MTDMRSFSEKHYYVATYYGPDGEVIVEDFDKRCNNVRSDGNNFYVFNNLNTYRNVYNVIVYDEKQPTTLAMIPSNRVITIYRKEKE